MATAINHNSLIEVIEDFTVSLSGEPGGTLTEAGAKLLARKMARKGLGAAKKKLSVGR